jgi:hypothetical protein
MFLNTEDLRSISVIAYCHLTTSIRVMRGYQLYITSLLRG